MAEATEAPKRKRLKQGHLPQMEPPSIPALDAAALIYYDAMQERVRLSKAEDEAKDNLIDKMKGNLIELYKTPDGLVVSVVNKSNVRVQKHKEATNGDSH